MRLTHFLLLGGVLLLPALCSCSEDPVVEKRREILQVPEAETPKPPPTRRRSQLYDEKGNLLPSEEKVAGIILPRGMKLKHKFLRGRIYETRVPLNKLHWYFQPRIQGGTIKRAGERTTYVAALPRDRRGAFKRIDLSIAPVVTNKRINLVEIREREPIEVRSATSTPLVEVRKRMKEQARRAQ